MPGADDSGEVYFLDGKTVLIESDQLENIEQNGRMNFTIIHETSHQVLRMLFPHDYGVKLHERSVHFCKANTPRRKPIEDWEEWQSNAFASAMLLPKTLIEQAITLLSVSWG